MRRSTYVGLVLVLVLVTSGCLGGDGGGEAGGEAVDAGFVADAFAEISTYGYEVNVTTESSLEGAQSGAPGASATVTSRQQIDASLDRESRTMTARTSISRSIEGAGRGQAPTGGERQQRLLLDDGTVYIGQVAANGSTRWTRGSDARLVDSVWQSQDIAPKYATLLERFDVVETGSETVDGTATTIYQVQTNGSEYRDFVVGTLNGTGVSGVSLQGGQATVENLTIRLWVEDDGTPHRASVEMVALTPRRSRQGGTQTVARQIQATNRFTDIGDSVEVTVPEQATSAPTVAERREASRQAQQNRSGGGPTLQP